MGLPSFQSDSTVLQLLQSAWTNILNPLVDNPVNKGVLLKSVQLSVGSNVINHKLGRKLQGWVLTRVRASSVVHDTQESNSSPELTLWLTSSAAVVVDIYVF